ncbi:prenylated Rab acceptor protein 1 [Orussus abietinus]|uniref:prenylated Rab acceptor protein 1 n=1 Tax=Orussus abietinus TaxID=222816 RepID=UPI00062556C7|nr:prenylated Rab acceptor protein 1 [Orussus abietinus]XP_012270894.1 prenylated Rab acceptor protein 1 [Orussus abietinus]XP_012270895.1 prenylated Rab acceptor protein 1 [Orussus abietinus]
MANIDINVTGDMQAAHLKQSTSGYEFLQLPQLPLGQLGYPLAQEWIQHRRATLRPWSLFLNTNNIRPPPSLTRLSKRVMRNIEYFQSNYLVVFIGLVIYCLITSPLLLLTVAASLGTCYKVSQRHAKQELMILNHKLTLAQVYSLVGICSLPLFYLVGAGAALFWVLGVSWFMVMLHAAFYNIDSVLCPGEDELNSLVLQEV